MPYPDSENSAAGQWQWLRPFAVTIAVCLAAGSLARAGLLLWLHDRVAATGGFGFVLLQGLRFDLVTLGLLLAVPMTLTPLIVLADRLRAPWLRMLRMYLLILIGLFVFMEASTPPFIQEYDARPNLLFVEYLRYPVEVLTMLFHGYKIELACALVLVWAAVWVTRRWLGRGRITGIRMRPSASIAAALLSLIVCVAAARSTLDHRPVNPSVVAFSSDPLVNTLALNSLYSVMYAVRESTHEDTGFPYSKLDWHASLEEQRRAMGLPDSAFTSTAIPTLHYQQATLAERPPKNLVILIEESLGAEFVGRLGGLPLTPNLDELADEGIWLENLYATGTRSARGLEAIVSGFPPTISPSVLKLPNAQRGFFTLGEFLRRKGYDTSFIYGGEAQFDNMRRFFANNGFDTIIDKHDFVNPVFYGSWGASDEDVFNVAHDTFMAHPPARPFFTVLFTTSNHTPFDYPDGRIELYNEPKATVENAVKYADYALGKFLRTAMAAPYWDNTVFVVVADHNSRVYGPELVPIERFHIPGLILGGGIPARKVERLASQVDLLPTLLSLIGVSGAHPATGIDLTRPDLEQLPGRAAMQFQDTQAYLEGGRVVILQKDTAPEVFNYSGKALLPAEMDRTLVDKAEALANWPIQSYRERLYRLP